MKKRLKNYPNYFCTTEGDIFHATSLRIKKKLLNKNGYLYVLLWFNGKTNTKSVHRLIAETFLKQKSTGMQVNHLNGIKTDNRVSNLEFLSPKDNTRHAVKSGLRKTEKVFNFYKRNRGDLHSSSKLKESQVIGILKDKRTLREIAREFGVSMSCVSCIKNKKSWKHIHKGN